MYIFDAAGLILVSVWSAVRYGRAKSAAYDWLAQRLYTSIGNLRITDEGRKWLESQSKN